MTYVFYAIGVFAAVSLLVVLTGEVDRGGSGQPFKLRPEPESLRFLRGLSEHEKPFIQFDSWAGYQYTAILSFRSVKVELEYNRIRRRWQLEVWDRQTCRSLYGYYETWSDAEPATRDFLLETYGLREKIDEMMERDRKRKQEDSQRTAALKAKYLTAKVKADRLEEL